MSTSPERSILGVASAQHDVIVRPQLDALDISAKVIDRMVRHGFLTRVRRGLYLVGPASLTTASQVMGAQLLLPGSAAYRRTAAQFLGLPGYWKGNVELVIPPDRFTPWDGFVLHETNHLPSVDITTIDGLACTTLERTLIDLVNVSSNKRIMWLVDKATDRDDFSVRRLQACFLSFARRGRGGTRRMRLVVDHFASKDPIPQSRLERAFRKLENRHDIGPGWVSQYRPPWYDGIRGIVDNACPEARLIAETDGRRWHRRDEHIENDRKRDRIAALHGWQVIRFGYEEVVERPAEVADELRSLREVRLAA